MILFCFGGLDQSRFWTPVDLEGQNQDWTESGLSPETRLFMKTEPLKGFKQLDPPER